MHVDPNRCDETPTLAEGEFICDNTNFVAGTNCHFKCPVDKVPIEEGLISCKELLDPESNAPTYKWDQSIPSFECVKVIRCLN